MSVAVASPHEGSDTQTWTIEQVCDYLHCGRSTLLKWIKAGRAPEPSRVGRRLLWDPAAIRALLIPPSSSRATAAP
jgi:excisionase family DNA binding protein